MTEEELAEYDEWCKIQEEEIEEQDFAEECDMDPIYWCWNCKYAECDRHK